jgi:hypothetical protein
MVAMFLVFWPHNEISSSYYRTEELYPDSLIYSVIKTVNWLKGSKKPEGYQMLRTGQECSLF